MVLTKRVAVSYNVEKKEERIMKKIWDNRWKKVLIWLSSYISFIAYAIVGGYVIVKSEDEDLRKTAKTALIVTLIFTVLSALYSILNSINSISGYSRGFAEFLSWYSFFQRIAQIAVFAVFIVMALFFGPENESASAKGSQGQTGGQKSEQQATQQADEQADEEEKQPSEKEE